MNKILVTKPFLPPLEAYFIAITKLWESHVLTNNGYYLTELEHRLAHFLQAESVLLTNNGTIALQIALQALGVKGKVITTPYSFVATANSILLSGLEPVFIDISDDSFNLDPDLIESAYSQEVSAIMPVHVYGIPCDNQSIEQSAKELGIKVIYDAAHAFNVKKNGISILGWGEMSVLSFHATKVFHTFEGGAIATTNQELKHRIDQLRNFGFNNSGDVECCGTNGKMNEAQAAMGLILLDHIEEINAKRKKWHDQYIEQLQKIEVIKVMEIPPGIEHNYSYFPILIQSGFPVTRDKLLHEFLANDIFPRRYFFPLITDFSLYKNYRIVSKHKISNARKAADNVICLPLYPDLTESDVSRVCDVINRVAQTKTTA